jgi:hypothetical protein
MKSELAFTLQDYQQHDIEAPDRIIANPTKCEGDLMTDDEIFDYCKDSLAVLRVMSEKNPPRATSLRQTFLTDGEFLLKIGRIKQEEFDMLMVESGAQEA